MQRQLTGFEEFKACHTAFGVHQTLFLHDQIEELTRDGNEILSPESLEIPGLIDHVALGLDAAFPGDGPRSPQQRDISLQDDVRTLGVCSGGELMQVFCGPGQGAGADCAAVRKTLSDAKFVDEAERSIEEAARSISLNIGGEVIEKPWPPLVTLNQQTQGGEYEFLLGKAKVTAVLHGIN